MPEVRDLGAGLAPDAPRARKRPGLRRRRRTGTRHTRPRCVEAGSADLMRQIGMPVEVIVVVGVGNRGGAVRIERDLEVVEQVPVRGPERAAGRDVAAVDEVIARDGLPEGRCVGRGVVAQRIEDLPVGVVVVRGVRCSVPDDRNRSRRGSRFEPRQQARPRVGTVADLHGLAPRNALVRRIDEVDVVPVRVRDIGRPVRGSVLCDFDREEDARHVARGGLVALVPDRRGVRGWGRARADGAAAP